MPRNTQLFYIYEMKNLKEVKNSTFRPLTGLSLYLHRIRNRLFRVPRSFRPLTGLSLYLLNQIHPVITDSINEFPSPHGVISISTREFFDNASTKIVFPSPHGVISISTISAMHITTFCKVSVPSRGYLYIYVVQKGDNEMSRINVSVPSRGYLYIYAILMKGKMKTRFAVSVPSRGYLYIYS